MCGEHLERGHDLGQRHALVRLPLLVVLNTVQEDDEVLVGAVTPVVNLNVVDVSARHLGPFCERRLGKCDAYSCVYSAGSLVLLSVVSCASDSDFEGVIV